MQTILIKSRTHGVRECLVDDEDFTWLTETYAIWLHRVRKKFYGECCEKGLENAGHLSLHRAIYARHHPLKDDEELDHKDGNSLNNQKSNLRIASSSQNNHNRKKFTVSASRYRGLKERVGGGWYVVIGKDLKKISVGSFGLERDAAIAYDLVATRLFGDFALLNIPDATEEEKNRVAIMLKNPKRELFTYSRYFGVTFNKRGGYWNYCVRINGKAIYGTKFKTELDAATARDYYIESNNLSNVRKSLAEYDPLQGAA